MVRAYTPQRMSGSISANSNYSPQGSSQILVSQFDTMAYEGTVNDWFNVSWQKRIQLTINAGQVPSTQTDFPLLINDVYSDLVGAEEKELRFIEADNVQLEYEIQEFDDSTGLLIAWFKKPLVNSGDIINIYFDNSIATDEQNAPAVWSNGFEGVWHMNNETTILDSTGNGNDGTIQGSVATESSGGKIGTTVDFPGGTGDFVDLPNSNTFPKGNTDRTISAWMLTRVVSNDDMIGFSYGNASNSAAIFLGKGPPTETLQAGGFGPSSTNITAPNVFDDNNYHRISLTYDGTTAKLYEGGNLLTTELRAWNTGANTAQIGRQVNNVEEWNGFVDEIHISNVVRDSDWLTTEFNNQNNNSTFYSPGIVESIPGLDIMRYEE